MKKKISILPRISIYRNYIDNVEEIFSFIKATKENKNNSPFIKKWEIWDEKGFVSESDPIYNFDLKNLDNYDIKKYNLILKLTQGLKTIAQEYINEWKNVGDWMFNPKNWSVNEDDSVLFYSSISYLMYNPTDPNYRLAMSYHTDQHQFEPEAPMMHQLFTLTIYLNDDYEDGELSFIDEENFAIKYYKPKQGDVTVFPSFYPYFHGVDPITSGEKYFARTFVSYKYEGSERWNYFYNQLGNTWLELEAERVKRDWNNPKYFRTAVFKDDSKDMIKTLHEHVGNVFPFPYNRKESKEKFMIKWED